MATLFALDPTACVGALRVMDPTVCPVPAPTPTPVRPFVGGGGGTLGDDFDEIFEDPIIFATVETAAIYATSETALVAAKIETAAVTSKVETAAISCKVSTDPQGGNDE